MVSLAVVALNLLLAGEASPAEPVWEKDWKRAFERARTEQRMVFVDFWASWCKPCLEMDAKTFPDPRVSSRLADFVLLKVDVDRSTIALAKGVSSFPTYVLFDPWEKERFRFSSFHEAEPFARKLELVRSAAPGMVEAGRSLEERESAEGLLLVGQSYLKVHATTDAREAFQRARKIANRDGNAAAAQTAATYTAFTWTIEGDGEKALKLLEKIVAKPVNGECEARVWIVIGHTRRAMKDTAAAAEAYRRALAACPENSPLRRDAETSLAALNP